MNPRNTLKIAIANRAALPRDASATARQSAQATAWQAFVQAVNAAKTARR